MNDNSFIALLQVVAGKRDTFTAVPDSQESWRHLLDLVAEHGLLGVTFSTIKDLRAQGIDFPREVFIPWGLAENEIVRRNQRQREAIADLYRQFLENGFSSCLLKGQSSGAYYPDPFLRQSGDIDLWARGSRQDVLSFLENRYSVRHVVYHHCDAKIFKDIPVEVHFTPTWMNSPFANRRLQKWFATQADEQFSRYDAALGYCTPTCSFDGVFLLVHIVRHVLDEGIGLRQLMDYFYLLQHLTEEDRLSVAHTLKRLGLLRFTGAVMYVLHEVFLMDTQFMLCRPDSKKGAFLLEEIIRSGNFGHSDARNEHGPDEGILAHAWRKIKRNLRFFRLCPSEVLWSPCFMVWQYFWRRKNGYLYKGR